MRNTNMTSKGKPTAVLGAALAALALAAPSRGALLVDDQFNDDSRAQTVAGIGAGTGGETEIPWFLDAATTTVVTDNTTPISGSALKLGGSTVGTFATGAGNVSLLVGDSITLTADFRFLNAGTSNVRFGLYNDNGTPASDAAVAGAPYTGDRGYLFI